MRAGKKGAQDAENLVPRNTRRMPVWNHSLCGSLRSDARGAHKGFSVKLSIPKQVGIFHLFAKFALMLLTGKGEIAGGYFSRC